MDKVASCPKAVLRKEIKKSLLSMTEEALLEKSESVCQRLLSLISDLIKQNHFPCSDVLTVGAYAPMRGEVNWLAIEDKFSFAFPAFVNGEMLFAKAKWVQLKETEDFGVKLLTPSQNSEMVVPDILFVPGLAFSKEGHRLGRGKGFYDRYLSQFSGVKIGVCLNDQLRSFIPCEDHDVMMNYVVTDYEVYSGV